MANNPIRILIVDDDTALVALLKDYLTLEGFQVESAVDGIQALEKLSGNPYDLIVLDVMMPGMTGTEVLAKLRERCETPVLMLTAKGDPIDRILGLELGADDYVAKPCPPRELVARMRAILRRSLPRDASSTTQVIRVGTLTVDTAHRRASIEDNELSLTGTELALLELLAREVGKPVAKTAIYPKVLGRPMGRFDRTIDVHVSSVRRKLAEAAGNRFVIESIRGLGYQLILNE